ncbi:MAG: Flp family type IVb pilin [Pseudonocardiales bacterium]|nr:MAG: Flp family type IVb pilin [Pseudonocardiales bacterium]
MLALIRNVIAFRRGSDGGASAVEYGLLIAAIAAVVVVILFALGGVLKHALENTCDVINGNGTAGTTTNCAT